MKKIIYLSATIFALSVNTSHAEQKADLSTYTKSPAAFAAVASAVAAAGKCSVPLAFEEKISPNSRVLGIHCRGTKDDELSIFIEFMEDEHSLLPTSFSYAG